MLPRERLFASIQHGNMTTDGYLGFNSVLPAVRVCYPALSDLQMCMKVTGLHRRDLPIIERTLWNDCTWFWLESDETFPVPQSSHFSLKSTPLIEGWRFFAELLQPVFRSTQKEDGDNRRNDTLPLPLISSISTHTSSFQVSRPELRHLCNMSSQSWSTTGDSSRRSRLLGLGVRRNCPTPKECVRRRVRWVWRGFGCPAGTGGTSPTVRHTPYTYHWGRMRDNIT